MEKIKEILGKYSVYVMLVFVILTYFSTCGTKTAIKVNSKEINALKETINYRDSLQLEVFLIEREISNLKIERSVLHNMNEIILKNIRPAQRVSEINNELDKLNEKLKNTK